MDLDQFLAILDGKTKTATYKGRNVTLLVSQTNEHTLCANVTEMLVNTSIRYGREARPLQISSSMLPPCF